MTIYTYSLLALVMSASPLWADQDLATAVHHSDPLEVRYQIIAQGLSAQDKQAYQERAAQRVAKRSGLHMFLSVPDVLEITRGGLIGVPAYWLLTKAYSLLKKPGLTPDKIIRSKILAGAAGVLGSGLGIVSCYYLIKGLSLSHARQTKADALEVQQLLVDKTA